MQPYVIKQGDHLALLAYKLGFDATTVWNDPSNASLAAIRSDPNVLSPGDLLYIPDPPTGPPPATPLTPGSTNRFVSNPPTMTLTHKFVDGSDSSAYAVKAYTVQELDQLTGLTTDGTGVATFEAPVTLTTATIVFTDTGESWTLSMGAMDPVNTLSGVFKRLQNLGFLNSDTPFDSQIPLNNLGVLRSALMALKAAQAASGAATAPESAPASGPGPNSAPPSTPAPISAPAAPDSGPPGTPAPDSPPASTPAPNSAQPSTPPPPNSNPPPASGEYELSDSGWSLVDTSSSGAIDPSGLDDAGALDPATTDLLRTAHGC